MLKIKRKNSTLYKLTFRIFGSDRFNGGMVKRIRVEKKKKPPTFNEHVEY